VSQLPQAFVLGNGAILTNVCLLPLYPALVAFVLYLLQRSFGPLLTIALPVIYGVVILLGGAMIAGWNPFTRLASVHLPAFRNPLAMAFAYGLLLGTMTLPCTGPIVVSAFLVGAGSVSLALDGVLYFLAFGLGFGWPLVVLPLLATPLQRRGVGWLTSHHLLLTRAGVTHANNSASAARSAAGSRSRSRSGRSSWVATRRVVYGLAASIRSISGSMARATPSTVTSALTSMP